MSNLTTPDPSWEMRMNRSKVRSLKAKATIAQIGLGAALAYWLVEALASATLMAASSRALPDGFWDTLAVAEFLYIALLVVTGVAFVTWSFSAHANLERFGRQHVRYSNHATIWWWLVPIATFFVPYKVVHETVRGSINRSDDIHWNDLDSPSMANWWTATFVAGLIISEVGSRALDAGTSAQQLDFGIGALLVGSCLMASAAGLAIGLINLTTAGQIRLANDLWAGQPGESPFPAPAGHGSYPT